MTVTYNAVTAKRSERSTAGGLMRSDSEAGLHGNTQTMTSYSLSRDEGYYVCGCCESLRGTGSGFTSTAAGSPLSVPALLRHPLARQEP